MPRKYKSFKVDDVAFIKQQTMSWGNRFSVCCFLNNNQYESTYNDYECLTAVGVNYSFEPSTDFFSSLSSFVSNTNDWIFGHFNYDIKNKIEPQLVSENPDCIAFPECFLYVPDVIILVKENELIIGTIEEDPDDIFLQINNEKQILDATITANIQSRITKGEYIEAVNKLKQHIQYGDCYVLNYCQEFFSVTSIDPLVAYQKLNKLSPNPFSAYYKLLDKFLVCASPERFIKKSGDKIISQPIKGTIARDLRNSVADNNNRELLFTSKKERSENVMVVDLVRNDLSKICSEGSVHVDELYGMYSFPHVHQMISTISCEIAKGKDFADVIKAMFPMGSMTGAPKIRVMELIEKYETSKRGIYSGTIGYITPEKDFDFNVVIRSLVYNQTSQYLSFHVGSALTAYCDAEKEYDECLLKGEAMMQIFSPVIK